MGTREILEENFKSNEVSESHCESSEEELEDIIDQFGQLLEEGNH